MKNIVSQKRFNNKGINYLIKIHSLRLGECKEFTIFDAWFGLNVESIARAPKARAKFGDVFGTNLFMNALFIDTAITITRSGTYTP